MARLGWRRPGGAISRRRWPLQPRPACPGYRESDGACSPRAICGLFFFPSCHLKADPTVPCNCILRWGKQPIWGFRRSADGQRGPMAKQILYTVHIIFLSCIVNLQLEFLPHFQAFSHFIDE
jgi:hypothetical protein